MRSLRSHRAAPLAHRIGLGLVLALACAAGLSGAEGPATPKASTTDKKGTPPSPPPPPATAPAKPEPPRQPGDYVIFVFEKATDVLNMVPDAVFVGSKKFQEMSDELARLREQISLKKAAPPSRCQLKGKVEGNAALLQIQFDFVTEKPDAVVALAGVPGLATSASLDGRTPLLRAEADGFAVQVEKPGDHQLSLDLVVPLAGRGPGRGLELSLPRAAVTTLDLDLPPGVKDVRVGGKPWADTLLTLKGSHLSGGLGPVDKLDLGWRGARARPGTPLLAAEGRIAVRLDMRGLTATAELTLRAEAGQTDRWRLLVPREAEVRLAPADEARLARPIESAEQGPGSLRTLYLREPSAEPIKVFVTTTGARPRSGTSVAVGPFIVPGAVHQGGTVQIHSTLAEINLDVQPHAGPQAIDLQRRPLTEEERRTDPTLLAAFRYGNVAPAEDVPPPGMGLGPWLDVTAGVPHGQVRTQVRHVLGLKPENGSLVWQSATTITAWPRWAEVDQIKVQLPDGWEPVEDLGDIRTGSPRVVTLKLARAPGEAGGAVTLTITGRYTDRHKPEGTATLGLPRPLGTDTQGESELKVQVGPELEILPATPAGLAPGPQTAHEQVWRSHTLPEAVTVSWRPYVPDVRAQSLADVDLTPRGGEVRQEILLQSGPLAGTAGTWNGPAQLTLRLPPGVQALEILEGATAVGAPEARGPGGSVQLLTLGKPSGGGHRLVLRYAFAALARAGEAAPFTVPLAAPEPITRGEARVRLWCAAGALPVLLDGTPWVPRPIEDAADRKMLPVLVAWAPRVDAALPLRWGEPQAAVTLLAERALVRVRVAEDGSQLYTVHYRLRQLAAAHLDVELPAPVAALHLQATLDRKRVAHEVLDDAGQPSDGGRVARLRLAPELVGPTSVLEVSYQLSPGHAGTGTLTAPLLPPVLRGDSGAVPTCWQVRVPPSWVVLSPESGPGVERTWGWRRWLLAPRLVPRGNGEWGMGNEEAGFASPLSDDPPALVCWCSGSEPLLLTHVPQQAWMLGCSLGLVAVGLALLGPGRSARGLGWGLVLLVLAAAAGAVLRPGALAAVAYGCEPGAAVLLGVLVIQWLLHERYRRQVVFLPSFSRGRSGSSLLRGSSATRPPVEPSTVDAPLRPNDQIPMTKSQ